MRHLANKAAQAAVLAAALSGCAEYEMQQQAAQAQARQQAQVNYVAGLRNRCAAYGYSPGTPEFSNCMMQVDQAQQAASQADLQQRRAIGAAILLNNRQ